MRSCDDILDILLARSMRGDSPEKMRRAMPKIPFSVVHVAGTNGKGTACYQIAKALEYSGYRVGLFTSPHIRTPLERIRINDTPIEAHAFDAYFEKVEEMTPGCMFFEVFFLMAIHYFIDSGVDVAVIETGIGGVGDSTNAFETIDLAVVTSIGMDHMQKLGHTLEEIAACKAGILKEDAPALLGPSAAYPVMYARAREVVVSEDITSSACSLLRRKFAISSAAEKRALDAALPCRFERRGRFIFDIAHNQPALAFTLDKLQEPVEAVVGFSRGKDISACLAVLAPKVRHMHFVSHGNRMCSPEELAYCALELGYRHWSIPPSVEAAMEHALGSVLVCGSVFIMDRALRVLEKDRALLLH